jgi:hypothetical protein
MYIQSRTVKGQTYYEAVVSYRDEKLPGEKRGKVKKDRVHLGKSPDVRDAFDRAEAGYFASRKGRTRSPFTEADKLAWRRLARLEQVLWTASGRRYQRSVRMQREHAKWYGTFRFRRQADSYADVMRDRDRDRKARQVLGVLPDATREDIKKAYRAQAQIHHPDKGGDTAMMRTINEAYETLTES